MTSLLRRASVRAIAVLPTRGAAAHGPIKPIKSNFPLVSEKVMGGHGFNRGSYTFWSLNNPITGPLYRPPWVVGGIHNPTIDPEQHFNTQDRFSTMTTFEWLKCFFYCLLPARVFFGMVSIPMTVVLTVTGLEQRREPLEIFMDRETYWENYDDFCYGVYFDHHHFSHQMCHRRSHKWGYAGLDVALEDEHHH